MGEITCELLLLISLKLWVESYDKVVAGAMAIATKTCKTIHTDEVIDFTADEPPVEFAMIINIPLDYEDEIEDQEDGDEEQDVDKEQEQDAIEDEYEEKEDNEDK